MREKNGECHKRLCLALPAGKFLEESPQAQRVKSTSKVHGNRPEQFNSYCSLLMVLYVRSDKTLPSGSWRGKQLVCHVPACWSESVPLAAPCPLTALPLTHKTHVFLYLRALCGVETVITVNRHPHHSTAHHSQTLGTTILRTLSL